MEGQVQWCIMELSQFCEVNKKLIWTKMWMVALNTSLVFSENIPALQQDFQAEVYHQNIQDFLSEVIMDNILLLKNLLAIILNYFLVVL